MRISIITICFNAAAEIRSTLDSVGHQTSPDIEYVIIDGGSRDGTLDVIREHGCRVDVMVSEPDRGIYDAMNKGIRASSGDVIVFINAGDYLLSPQTIELVATYWRTCPDVDVVYGGIEVRYPDGRTSDFLPTDEDGALKFLIEGSLPHQATFARRRVFGRVGLFDTAYKTHADYDWFLKIATDPAIRMRRIPHLISSFGLGGASSDLERGEAERHRIQNNTPALQTETWLRQRIEIYQNLYLSLRLQNESLRRELAGRA